MIFGMKVVENRAMTDIKRYQRRIHRSSRVNKKWAKRYGFRTVLVPKKALFVFGNCFIGHPDTIKAIREKLEAEAK